MCKDKRMKKPKTLTIILASIVILYGTTVKVSESNFACGSCHTLQNETWHISTHKNIDCTGCHIESGMSGAIEAQVTGVKNLFIAVFSGIDTLTREKAHEPPLPISTQTCMSCHGAILYYNELGYEDIPENNTLQGQGLLIAHRSHIEKHSVLCVECHRGITHRDPDDIRKYKTNWPFMTKDCEPCHDGKFSDRFQVEVTSLEDKKKCIVCHPTIAPPPEDEYEYIK
jgi:nitrate/TMAO reductase-like tetraheme cytochrome c subunit